MTSNSENEQNAVPAAADAGSLPTSNPAEAEQAGVVSGVAETHPVSPAPAEVVQQAAYQDAATTVSQATQMPAAAEVAGEQNAQNYSAAQEYHAQQPQYAAAAQNTYVAPASEYGYPNASQAGFAAQQTVPQPENIYAAGSVADVKSEKQRKRKKMRPITMAATAGIAIGAVVGGIFGGGIATYVTTGKMPAGNAAATGGTITVNNSNNASQVTAVAATSMPSVVTLSVASSNSGGEGSGVILNEDGYIATNAHVVTLDGESLNTKIVVTLSDGRRFNAKLVGYDPYADLAVVKIKAEGLSPIKFANSNKLNVGDATVAIGAPLTYANSVTSGVISALNRGISVSSSLVPGEQTQNEQQDNKQGNGLPWEFRFFNQQDGQGNGSTQQRTSSNEGTITLSVIQTDASINQGNSGGALLNSKGELIGINVALAGADGSSGNVGLGFALPSNLVKRITSAIIAGEEPTHGLLGVGVSDSTNDEDEDANHLGALLVNVTKDGAADKAGLKAGDVVTAVNGVPVSDGTGLSGLIRTYAGGSEVTLSYSRGGKFSEANVTLGTLKSE